MSGDGLLIELRRRLCQILHAILTKKKLLPASRPKRNDLASAFSRKINLLSNEIAASCFSFYLFRQNT